MDERYETQHKRYSEANQAHVFKDWNELTSD